MARHVFFSFHYDNDINRSMVVRNNWVTQGSKEAAGFIDKAEFEEIKRKGDDAIHNWIDNQINGTSVTVVLIGSETLERPYVQYEIRESIKRGNGLIGVRVHNISDMGRGTAPRGIIHTKIGVRGNKPAYFDDEADAIYDYIADDGYENLGNWIEAAAKKHDK